MSASSAAAAPSGVAYVKSGAELDFSRIWSSITSLAGDSPPTSLLFVSPGTRQGATTIAAGVALTAAQANPDLRLGLLECNFHAPSMSQLFQIPASPGIVDALAGTTDPAELGYAIGVHSNLLVIPAGQISAEPLSLLRPAKISPAISSLTSRFDMLLVDTAAVNQYPDAQCLASLLDAIVLVVDADKAPRQAIAKAKQILQTARGHLLGTVLNRRTHPVPSIFYGRS